MSTTVMAEPFPQTTSIRPLINHNDAKPRLRRKSSNLPGDPPGDTGTAVSTSPMAHKSQAHSHTETSPAREPTSSKSSVCPCFYPAPMRASNPFPSASARPQAKKSKVVMAPLQVSRAPSHLDDSPHRDTHHPRPLRAQPDPLESYP